MAESITRGEMRLDATLPGSSYCDPEVLEREWERIFCRSWLCAGREERIKEPGDFFTVPVGRENRNHPAAVVRDADFDTVAVRQRVEIHLALRRLSESVFFNPPIRRCAWRPERGDNARAHNAKDEAQRTNEMYWTRHNFPPRCCPR